MLIEATTTHTKVAKGISEPITGTIRLAMFINYFNPVFRLPWVTHAQP